MNKGRLTLFAVAAYAVVLVVLSSSCEDRGKHAPETVTDTLFDTEYLRQTFYRVDTLPPTRSLTNVRVYMDDANPYNNTGAQSCLATVFPDDSAESTAYSGDRALGYFDLKRIGTDYIVDSAYGRLQFTQPVGSNCTIGISYTSGPDTVGGYRWVIPQISETILVLKLIKPMREDAFSQTWGLVMKNAYSLGARTSVVSRSACCAGCPAKTRASSTKMAHGSST